MRFFLSPMDNRTPSRLKSKAKQTLILPLVAASVGFAAQANAVDCSNLATWSAGDIYNGGDQVQHSGSAYTAAWWTQNANPAQNSGQWQVWKLDGSAAVLLAQAALQVRALLRLRAAPLQAQVVRRAQAAPPVQAAHQARVAPRVADAARHNMSRELNIRLATR